MTSPSEKKLGSISAPRAERYFRGIALVIVSIAFFLRVSTLASRSMWLDEGLNYWVAVTPLAYLMNSIKAGLQHPPLFPLLFHFWTRVGQSEFVLRYLSLFFSVASVAGLMLLGKRFWGARAGLVAGFLSAISPSQIRYGQDMSPYALLVLCLVLNLLALQQAYTRNQKKWWWLWGGTLVVALYVHYGSFVPVTAIALTIAFELGRERRWRNLRELVFIGIVCAFAIIPLIILFVPAQLFQGPTVQAFHVAFGNFSEELGQWFDGSRQLVEFQFVNGLNLPGLDGFEWTLWLPLAACLLFIFLNLSGKKWNKKPLVWLVIAWLLYYGVSKFNLLPFVARYTLILAPLLFLVVAFGIDRAIKTSPTLGVIALIWIGGLGLLAFPPPNENVRAVTQFWAEHRAPSDATYVYYAAQPTFRYYLIQQNIESSPSVSSLTSIWYLGCWDGKACPNRNGNIYYGVWLRALEPSAKMESIGATMGGWRKRFWIVFAHPRLGEEQQLLSLLDEKYSVALASNQSDASVYLLESK